MSTLSNVDLLPADVKAWLDRELPKRRFRDYAQLAQLLTEQGCQVSKSGLHRYGQRLRRKTELVQATTEAARIINEAAPDEADERSAAVVSLVQSEIFEVLLALQEAQTEGDATKRLKLLAMGAKGIADLTKASVIQKKWASTVRARVEAAAANVEKITKTKGLSAETVAQIRNEIIGIAAL